MSDIFAFGCVLYEMFAGRKAFEGGSALEGHCRDHAHRAAADRCTASPRIPCSTMFSDAASKRIPNGDGRTSATSPASCAGSRKIPRASRSRQHRRIARGAFGRMAIVADGRARSARRRPSSAACALEGRGSGAGALLPSASRSPRRRPTIRRWRCHLTARRWLSSRPRIACRCCSSDRLGDIENRALAGTEGASLPFWSPDGRTIGFFAGDKLKRIDVAGGTPLVVADAPTPRGGAWNGDGVILFASGVGTPIKRVSTRGGPTENVTDVNAGSGPAHRLPHFLPDGKRFLFTSTLGTAETNGVYVGSLDKTPPVRLLPGDTGGRFAAPDKLLTIKQGVLQAYTFNVGSAAVQGEPIVIAQGFGGASASGGFAASDTGVLAYRAGAAQRRQLVWVNRQGHVIRIIGEAETDFIASPELSPDDQSVVVFRQPTGDNDIWVIELARNLARRVTDGPPADAHPLWDPDGLHVVFSSRRFGSGSPARLAVSGGKVEPLFSKDEDGLVLAWTRDRQYILLRRSNAKTGSDLVAVAPSGDAREVVVAQSQHDETEGQFSPDGKWVTYVSNESGHAGGIRSVVPGRPGADASVDGRRCAGPLVG